MGSYGTADPAGQRNPCQETVSRLQFASGSSSPVLTQRPAPKKSTFALGLMGPVLLSVVE